MYFAAAQVLYLSTLVLKKADLCYARSWFSVLEFFLNRNLISVDESVTVESI